MQILSRQELVSHNALRNSPLLGMGFAEWSADADCFALHQLTAEGLIALSMFQGSSLQEVLILRRVRLSYAQQQEQDYLYRVRLDALDVGVYCLRDQQLSALYPITVKVTEQNRGLKHCHCMPNTPLSLKVSLLNNGQHRALRIGDDCAMYSGLPESSENTRLVAALAAAELLGRESSKFLLRAQEAVRSFELTQEAGLVVATGTKKQRAAQDQRLLAFGVSPSTAALGACLDAKLVQLAQARELSKSYYNQLCLHCLEEIDDLEDFQQLVKELIQQRHMQLFRLGVTQVSVSYRHAELDWAIEATGILEGTIFLRDAEPAPLRLSPASRAQQRELQVRARGGVWAYRIPVLLNLVLGEFLKCELGRTRAPGLSFTEMDLDYEETVIHPSTGSIDPNHGELIPVQRPPGSNEAGVVIGLVETDLGLAAPLRRLLIIGDLSHPSRGSLRGQECVRINAAIRYASEHDLPIDWFAASFGVQIHHERGVEGLDAAASTLRELVHHCHQRRLQVNFVVDEANIGAQSYWDSMAAILYQTSGILIMTPKGSMALTGAKSLACALFGTINSEEIGKYVDKLYPDGLQSLSGATQVHAPNSECMVYTQTLEEACYKLTLHHYYAYLNPGDVLCTRRLLREDPQPFEGDLPSLEKAIFSFLSGQKPDRECVINAIRDRDAPSPLDLWAEARCITQQTLKSGDLPQVASTIVRELLIGGQPSMLIFTPTGPLTPADSNVIARAINKASGRMQVLIIGSLSGFSCDPLSMANHQLQEGALIAKAIVEHEGPILVVNLGALVGGTFVVFNKQLNPNLRILAVEGARVQVIGGKSAAKVVFHSSIKRQASQDRRVLSADLKASDSAIVERIQKASGRSLKQLRTDVIEELEDEEADRFDRFHNARRALKVGSIDAIVVPKELRQSIIAYFEQMRLDYRQRKQERESAA